MTSERLPCSITALSTYISWQILSSRVEAAFGELSLCDLASLGEEGLASQRSDVTRDETFDIKVAGPSSDF